MNSVLRHITGQHKAERLPAPIFDYSLGTRDAPRMRRGAAAGVANPAALAQGPTDDQLFKKSEEIRKEKMCCARKDHVEWIGGEEALLEAVPKYPVWQPRDHPYGRVPPSDGLLTNPLQAEVHRTSTRTLPAPCKSWSSSTASTFVLDDAPITPPAATELANASLPWMASSILPALDGSYYYDASLKYVHLASTSPTATAYDDVTTSPYIDPQFSGSFGTPVASTDPLQNDIFATSAAFAPVDGMVFVDTLAPNPYEGWPNLWDRFG